MKIKKILFLLLLPVIAEFAVSCGECNCEETVFLKYSNKVMWLSNIDNSGPTQGASLSDTIIKTAYGIRMELQREQTACNKEHGFVFFPSAYALKCDCPSPLLFSPKDSITSIKVFSLNAFDNDHAANADISLYFKVFNPYQNSFSTLEDYPASLNIAMEGEEHFISSVGTNLLLMTPPTLNTQHRFKVQLVLTDGRVLEQTIEAVLI